MTNKKFYLETYGCKLNQADSALIRKVLSKEFQEASVNEADFVILNTCGVVEKTERKILKRAKNLKKQNKKIILSGCLPLISLKDCQEIGNGIVGPDNILSFPVVIKRIFKNKKPIFLKDKPLDKARLRCFAIIKESSAAILPISEGCLGNCSFCVTKLARKKLKSFDQKEIIKNVKMVLEAGVKEIQLTCQDLAIYGLDKKKFLLPNLLKEISKIDGRFKIRLGMMSPLFTKHFFDDLLKIMENDKFYRFLHIPFQSGSNEILKLMNRNYKIEDFLKLVKEFRTHFKDSMLATDVIVGFPQETEKDFQETVKVIKEIKPDILHIFRYSKRKKAESFYLKDFPDRIKKERSRILTGIWLNICKEKNRRLLGKNKEVLITEKRGNMFLARTNSYKAVILKEGKIGQFLKVKILEDKPNYLIGAKNIFN